MSHSLAIGSETFWFPFVENESFDEEVLSSLNERHGHVIRYVANLTAPQIVLFNKSKNPNLFFPQAGLFLADYMVGILANRVLRKKG